MVLYDFLDIIMFFIDQSKLSCWLDTQRKKLSHQSKHLRQMSGSVFSELLLCQCLTEGGYGGAAGWEIGGGRGEKGRGRKGEEKGEKGEGEGRKDGGRREKGRGEEKGEGEGRKGGGRREKGTLLYPPLTEKGLHP